MMRRLTWLFAIAVAASAAAEPRDATWSPVVYPPQRLPLVFSHAKHLARGAACTTCHPSAATSQSAVDNLLPTELQCRACHLIDRPPHSVNASAVTLGNPWRGTHLGAPWKSQTTLGSPRRSLEVPDGGSGTEAAAGGIDRGDSTKLATRVTACAACHPGWTPGRVVERVYLPPPPLKFAHARHAQVECERCHVGMRAVDLATARQLPTMASCLSCHASGGEERRCADCHLTQRGGLIETHFEHGQLVPHSDALGEAHGVGFAADHKSAARATGATCHACHDRSECVACHQGVVKPMDFHPGNYLLTHAVEARRGRPDCSACHRAQSFCVACHERSGLGTRADRGFDSASSDNLFHPAGWASAGVGPNAHAQEARRNVTACASCHREDDCLRCHSAEPGGLRASPHPANWRGSARCRALDRGNRRMCLRCHVTPDELGCDWRRE